jgi:GTP cyclohydrolase II
MKISEPAQFPTSHGVFQLRGVEDDDGREHVVVYKGDITHGTDVPVRVHSECLTSEVFNCLRCDCNDQLEAALRYIELEGRGVLIYLRQEGRGIGLYNKIRAYALQDKGLDTIDANEQLGFQMDMREYGVAVDILNFLEISSVRLLTNNPAKVSGLEAAGIAVVERVPHHMPANPHNADYLETKRKKSGHLA